MIKHRIVSVKQWPMVRSARAVADLPAGDGLRRSTENVCFQSLPTQTQMSSAMSQNRDFFRIPFPIAERPRLLARGDEFRVLDLSESGASIVGKCLTPSTDDEPFAVTIHFNDGKT